MVNYKCFHCGKEVKQEYLRKKVRCPHCGSKLVYKARSTSTTMKAE